MNTLANKSGNYFYRDVFNQVLPLPRVFFHGTSKEYVEMQTDKEGFYQRPEGLWLDNNVSIPLILSVAAQFHEPGGFTPYLLIVNAEKAMEYANLYPTSNGHFGISRIDLKKSQGIEIMVPEGYDNHIDNIHELLAFNKKNVVDGIIQCLGLEEKTRIAFKSIDYTGKNLAPMLR